MDRFVSSRTISLILGLIGAVFSVLNYQKTQSSLVVVLVFVGCLLFWAWIASLVVSLVLWFQSEIFLMGRRPRIQWHPTPFNVAKLVARLLGVALPFLIFRGEGWAVFTNPDHWALVPVTLGICMGLVAIPLWVVIKYGADKLRQSAS